MLPVEPSVFKNMIGITKDHLISKRMLQVLYLQHRRGRFRVKLVESIQFERDTNLGFVEQQQTWLKHAKQRLQQKNSSNGNAECILVGSLPFDNRDLPEMSIAEAKNTYVTEGLDLTEPLERLSQVQATLIPPQADYVDGVAKLVALMKSTELEKAVLARAIDLQSEQKIQIEELFYQLFKTNPEGYTFALHKTQKNKVGSWARVRTF